MSIAAVRKITSQLFHSLNHLESLWWVLLRVWIAVVFFKSGLTKIEDFETTIMLFEEEYKVPMLSPYFAAISATFFEITMPVALVLGLATRFAAIPLLIMTAVIQFTYMDHVQHYYWAIVLLGLILHGGGNLSADYLIKRRYGDE